MLRELDQRGPTFISVELIEACERIVKDSRLDVDEVAVKAIRLLLGAVPGPCVDFFNRSVRNNGFFEGITVHGFTAAKVRGPVAAAQIRAILPVPSVLAVIETAIAKRLNTFVDTFATTVGGSFLEAARRQRQPLDVVLPLQLEPLPRQTSANSTTMSLRCLFING